MHQSLEERDLLLDIRDIIVFGVEVDDLEGDNMARVTMSTFVHGAISALADNFEFLKVSATYWQPCQGSNSPYDFALHVCVPRHLLIVPTSYIWSGNTSFGCRASDAR